MKTLVLFCIMPLFQTIVAMLTLQNLIDVSTKGRPGFNSTLSHLDLVDPETLQSQIQVSNLVEHLQEFERFATISPGPDGAPNRQAGSLGHIRSITYITKLLDSLKYYDIALQPVCTKRFPNPKPVWSFNLIATSRVGNPNDTLLLGAHLDSVAVGPGINDNASGSAALLELAIVLARYKTNSRVRFAWWTEEEQGMLGSYFYTKSTPRSELDRTRLYLNLDMVASPNYKLERYLSIDGDSENEKGETSPAYPGSRHAADAFARFFAANGLNSTTNTNDSGSDHRPFEWAGIPTSGLTTGSAELKSAAQVDEFGGRAHEPFDRNYHSINDTVANINQTAFEIMAMAITNVVATYARSFDGFPERNLSAKASLDDDDLFYMNEKEKFLC